MCVMRMCVMKKQRSEIKKDSGSFRNGQRQINREVNYLLFMNYLYYYLLYRSLYIRYLHENTFSECDLFAKCLSKKIME